MTEYEEQAQEFLDKTGSTIKATFKGTTDKFIEGLTNDVYKVTLARGDRKYIFDFTQSHADSGFKLLNTNTKKQVKYTWMKKEEFINLRELKRVKMFLVRELGTLAGFKIIEPETPNAYDILSGVQKYDVGTFEDFCSDYGYDDDSRKAEITYKAVLDEYNNLKMLYSDSELEVMGGIDAVLISSKGKD